MGKKVCIWKLSDADNTVYLAGSVHLLRKSDLPIPSAYETVYRDSDRVIFEVDMKVMEDPATLPKLRKLGVLPEGDKLENHLSTKTMSALRSYLKTVGIPRAQLDRSKPGMVLLTISTLQAMKMGASPENGLETQFYKRCIEENKPSSGLETMEYQLNIFNELSDEEVDAKLTETFHKMGEEEETLEKMIAFWKNGEPEKMGKLIDKEMKPGSRFRKLLLTDRNRNWIPAIEKALLGKENTLFLVGTAHLTGNGSVVDLLRERGLKFEQLTIRESPASAPREQEAVEAF